MRSWLIILIIAALTYLYFSQSNNQQALDSPTDPDSVIKLNTGIDSKDVEDTETIKKRRENVGSREASRLNKDQSEVLAAVKKDWPNVKSQLGFPSDVDKSQVGLSKLSSKQISSLVELEQRYATLNSTRLKFDESGQISQIFPSFELGNVTADSGTLEQAVLDMIAPHSELFADADALEIRDSSVNCVADQCRIEVKKSFNGLPAWDHDLVVSTKGSKVVSIQGAFNRPGVDPQAPKNLLSGSELLDIARSGFLASDRDLVELTEQAELGIGQVGANQFVGYRFQVGNGELKRYQVYVDAHTKKLVRLLPLYSHAQVSASGENLSGQTYAFQAEQTGDKFYMLDKRLPIGHETIVYIREGSSPWPYVSSSDANVGWDPSAVSALQNFEMLVNYYKSNHNYDAVDKYGKTVQIGINLPELNAWSTNGESHFVFGKTVFDGVEIDFARSLDVMAHEITHEVINTNGGLEYQNQSGALNESISDSFGSLVDSSNWDIGEDLDPNSRLLERDMANPNLPSTPPRKLAHCASSPTLTVNQPAHMLDFVKLPFDPPLDTCDNGGVHINSGIPNRAFYLLAEGLTAEGTGESVGRTKAGELLFKTMLQLPKTANFIEAAQTMLNQALNDYGADSTEYAAVNESWKQVGLEPRETETISVAQLITSDNNWIVYLNPYYDIASVESPSDNIYNLYIQLVDADQPSYIADTNYGPLNGIEYASYNRPTMIVFQDGSFSTIYRGATTGKLYVYNSTAAREEPLELDGYTFSDIAFSTDGSTLIFSVLESGLIFTYDLVSDQLFSTVVRPPTTAEGVDAQQARFVDTIRFDPTNRYIVFDYLSCLPTQFNDCDDADAVEYWAIGLLEVASQKLLFPFPSQPDSIDVGYPSFSNKTDNYITFDLIDYDADTDSGIATGIYIYDIYNGSSFEFITKPDITTEQYGSWGSPSFSADDSGLIYDALFDNGAFQYQVTLDDYTLTAAEEKFVSLNPFLGYLNSAIPSATIDRVPTLNLRSSKVELGDVIVGVSAQGDMCASNLGGFSLRIKDFAVGNNYLNWQANGAFIESAEEVCAPVVLNSTGYSVGAVEATVSIVHDGVNSPTAVSITAYIDYDTDSDGILNYKDDDDDNDEVLDVNDAFPLDASESVDTDGDRTGNNADADDDNDSLSDAEESTIGTNPLLADTDADGVADNLDDLPLDKTEVTDTDGDGIGNNADDDDDGDSLSDSAEANLGTNPLLIDSDSDGVDDDLDALPLNSSETKDTDGDGIGNNADPDDDNDGFSDDEELTAGTDPLSASSCPGCFTWDIDGDGEAKALTDGLLVIRHLFGFVGESLTGGAIGIDAERTAAAEVTNYLQGANSELDIDGDGDAKALTDGLLLIRSLFGFSGEALISGAIGSGATRISSEAISEYIDQRMP